MVNPPEAPSSASEASTAPDTAPGPAWRRFFPLVWLLLITIAGTALRLAFAFRSGLWRDEALTMAIIGAPDFWDYEFHHDSHPPLYYLLNRAVWALFGAHETPSLALSVVFGMVAIPAIYVAGSRMFSRSTGLIAATLLAFAPFAAEYAGVLRPYSLLPLLALGSLYFLWASLRHGGVKHWAAFSIVTAVMLYSHNWGLLIAAAEGGVSGLYLLWRRPGWAVAKAWALAQLGIALLYAPWVPVLLEQARHAGHVPQYWFSPHDPSGTWRNLGTAFQMFARSVLSLPQTLWTAGLLAAVATWVLTEEPKGEDGRPQLLAPILLTGVPLVTFALAFVGSGHSNLLHEKCMLAFAPAALLLVARAISTMPLRPLVPVVLTGILVAMYVDADRKAVVYSKSDAREVARVVEANTRPGDMILVAPEWIASSFNFYYRADTPQLVFPGGGKRVLVSFRDVAERTAAPQAWHDAVAAITAHHAAGERLWFVADAITFYDTSEPPPGPEVPAHYHPRDFAAVSNLRARQLERVVKRLYGEPTFVTPGSSRPLGYESVVGKLYEVRD